MATLSRKDTMKNEIENMRKRFTEGMSKIPQLENENKELKRKIESQDMMISGLKGGILILEEKLNQSNVKSLENMEVIRNEIQS